MHHSWLSSQDSLILLSLTSHGSLQLSLPTERRGLSRQSWQQHSYMGINGYLEGNLTDTACPLRKMTSPRGPVTSPVMVLLRSLPYQTWIPPVEQAPNSIRKSLVSYPSNRNIILHPQAHLASSVSINVHRMHSWVTLDDSSPPEAYRAHLGTMRDNQQRGSFQPNFNLIPFSPPTRLCGVFGSRVLCSSGE